MPKYRLNIHFKEDDLNVLAKAHQKVILVKHTAGSKDTSVSWVSFKPWQINTVDWKNDFAIYASNSEVQSGAYISKLSDKMATTGVQYSFSDGTFNTPTTISGAADNNTFYARNYADDYPAITLGLAQSVVVNGQAFANNPINAVYVPYGQCVSMTPIERVDIYMLNDITDSTVVSHISSVPLEVSYEEGESEHSIAYNGKTGQFFLES